MIHLSLGLRNISSYLPPVQSSSLELNCQSKVSPFSPWTVITQPHLLPTLLWSLCLPQETASLSKEPHSLPIPSSLQSCPSVFPYLSICSVCPRRWCCGQKQIGNEVLGTQTLFFTATNPGTPIILWQCMLHLQDMCLLSSCAHGYTCISPLYLPMEAF